MYLSYNTYWIRSVYIYQTASKTRRRLINCKFFKYTPDKTISKSFCHIANPLGGCNYEVYLEKEKRVELTPTYLIYDHLWHFTLWIRFTGTNLTRFIDSIINYVHYCLMANSCVLKYLPYIKKNLVYTQQNHFRYSCVRSVFVFYRIQ